MAVKKHSRPKGTKRPAKRTRPPAPKTIHVKGDPTGLNAGMLANLGRCGRLTTMKTTFKIVPHRGRRDEVLQILGNLQGMGVIRSHGQ